MCRHVAAANAAVGNGKEEEKGSGIEVAGGVGTCWRAGGYARCYCHRTRRNDIASTITSTIARSVTIIIRNTSTTITIPLVINSLPSASSSTTTTTTPETGHRNHNRYNLFLRPHHHPRQHPLPLRLQPLLLPRLRLHLARRCPLFRPGPRVHHAPHRRRPHAHRRIQLWPRHNPETARRHGRETGRLRAQRGGDYRRSPGERGTGRETEEGGKEAGKDGEGEGEQRRWGCGGGGGSSMGKKRTGISERTVNAGHEPAEEASEERGGL